MTNALEAARILEPAWQALSHALLTDNAEQWDGEDQFYLIKCSDHGNLSPLQLTPPEPEAHVEDILHLIVLMVTKGRLEGEFLPPPDVVGATIICHGWLPPEDEMDLVRARIAAGTSLPPVQSNPGRRRTRFAVTVTSDGRCYEYIQLRGHESDITPSPINMADHCSLRVGLDTLLFALSPKVD